MHGSRGFSLPLYLSLLLYSLPTSPHHTTPPPCTPSPLPDYCPSQRSIHPSIHPLLPHIHSLHLYPHALIPVKPNVAGPPNQPLAAAWFYVIAFFLPANPISGLVHMRSRYLADTYTTHLPSTEHRNKPDCGPLKVSCAAVAFCIVCPPASPCMPVHPRLTR